MPTAGDPFRRAFPGQTEPPSATAWNALIDMLRQWREQQGAGSSPLKEARDRVVVRVSNNSGGDLDRWSILAIGSPIITPAENEAEFESQVTFEGDTPDGSTPTGRWVVLLEPIPDGNIGRAIISGVTACRIAVPGSLGTYAECANGVTATLATGSTGSARILWAEGSGSERWAIVRLGDGSGTPATPALIVREADGSPSGTPTTLQIPSASSGSPLNLTDLGGGTYQLDISEASGTQEGTISTGIQTIAGDKTFGDDVSVLGNLHVDTNTQLDGTLDVEGLADFAEQVTVAAGSNKGILIGASGNQIWSMGATGSSTVIVSAVDGFSRYGRMDLHSNGGIYLWNSLLSGYEPQRIIPGQTSLTFTVYTGTGTSYADVVIDASAKELQLPSTWDVTVGGVSIIGLTAADIGVTVQGYDADLDAIAAGTWTGATSITTLGTIATGTWQGTRIGSAYGGVPSGTVTPFAGSSVPTGWLECDGTAVSRTTYADLFTAISTTWGAGDGSTTFNLPDLRGRAPIGAGTGSGLTARTLGTTGGAESHTLTTSEMPNHSHEVVTKSNATGFGAAGASARANAVTDGHVDTNQTGSGNPHTSMQPWAALKFIIKT